MTRHAILVSTEQEAAALRKRVPLKVLVLPFPLFGHEKKTKAEIDTLSAKDFRFLHASKFEDFLTENDVTQFNVLAPHNQDGLDWLAHVDHLSCMPWQNDTLVFEYRTYTNINYAERSLNVIGRICLEKAYKHYIFGSIVSAKFYNKIAKPLAKKIFGTVKGAYSLGMYRTIYFLYHMENKRALHFKIPSGVLQNATYVPRFHVCKPITYWFNTETGIVEPDVDAKFGNSILSLSRLAVDRSHEQGIQESIYDDVDPYVTCLLSGFPLKNFTDMVSLGILSVPVPSNIECASYDDLSKGMDDRLLYLMSNSVLMDLARKHFESGSRYGTFVLRSLDAHDCCNEVGHAVLFERYNTDTLIRILPSPRSFVMLNPAYCSKNSSIGHHLLIQDPSLPGVEPSDCWTRLLDPSLLLSIPGASAVSDSLQIHVNIDVSDDTSVVANLFQSLAHAFGYKYGYIYNMLKSLERRGILTISNTGVRITSYGFGIGSMLNAGTGHNESTSENDHGFQGLDKCWHDSLKASDVSSTNLMDDEFLDETDFESLLAEADAHLKEISVFVENYDGLLLRKRNKKTGKLRKYKLVLDRDKKISYWKSISGNRKLPVAAEITKYNPSGLDHMCEGHAPVHELMPTHVNSKTLSMIEIMESACCECGHMLYHYEISEKEPVIELRCKSCSARYPALFNPIVANLGKSNENIDDRHLSNDDVAAECSISSVDLDDIVDED